MSFSISAFAKINLALHVTGRREDGYHLLESLVTFSTHLADHLIFSPAREFSLSITGPFSDHLAAVSNPDNLIYRTIDLFSKKTGYDQLFSITLEKNIPIGAGLGGGSSDAAATIHALDYFCDQTLTPDEKNKLLLSLGADVPVCYGGNPALIAGIGDIGRPAPPFPAVPCVMIWPDVGCATKDIFKEFGNDFQKPLPPYGGAPSDVAGFLAYLGALENGLEAPALKTHPIIKNVFDALKVYAPALIRMTGSGSCVIGYFHTPDEAMKVCQSIQKTHPSWWCHADIARGNHG